MLQVTHNQAPYRRYGVAKRLLRTRRRVYTPRQLEEPKTRFYAMTRQGMNLVSCALVAFCFVYLITMLSGSINQTRLALAQKDSAMAELTALAAKKEQAMWHCDGYKPRKSYRYFKSLHKHVEGLK
jgi:hypothetical protein